MRLKNTLYEITVGSYDEKEILPDFTFILRGDSIKDVIVCLTKSGKLTKGNQLKSIVEIQ